MKKLILLLFIPLVFACSSDDEDNNSNETFLEKYDGIVWGYPTSVDPNDPLYGQGCFFYPINDAFVFKKNPPSKIEFPLLDPLMTCNTILFSNPNYVIAQNSENIFSYTYEDSEGTHMITYTVSEDGNTLIFEDENCITPQVQFTKLVGANPCVLSSCSDDLGCD